MKIAVSSSGKTLESKVDERFGRAPYFLIVEGEKIEVLENPNLSAGGGVGIQTAQMLADKGVEAVIAGSFGPKAYETLAAADIKMYSGSGMKILEAVESLRKNQLKPMGVADKPSHW